MELQQTTVPVTLAVISGVGAGTESVGRGNIIELRALLNSLSTVIVVEVVMDPLRVAVQLYCPA